MTKKERKEQKAEAKKMFYNMMDKRDLMYKLLLDFEAEHNFIPEEYKKDILLMNACAEYKKYKGWRNVPGAKLIISKAIQRFCKNANNKTQKKDPSTPAEYEAYLKKQTKYIYDSIDNAKQELEKKKKKKPIDKNLKE